jgi:hypothetical protein
VELQSEEITEDIKEILDDIEVLSGEVVGHGQAIDALELKIDDLVEITYSDLKALRDAGNLVPGRQYRITDYDCTTVQEDTRSAMKPFDIIVVADSNDKLNENARAVQSARDTDGYFSNSNLAAWQLKYCLDNDTDRFAWADPENGKGVIYWMKDEFNNECPYDFKNIQYKKKLNSSGEYDGTGTDFWLWTFTDISEMDIKDITVGVLSEHISHSNVISPYTTLHGEESDILLYTLNNIILISSPSFESNIYETTNNKFDINCRNIVLNYGCSHNRFKEGSHYVVFKCECCNNVISGYSVNFGENCSSNTLGNSCNEITFGNDCYSNTFGNACYSNTFGDSCDSNTFGDECYDNTFGNYCRYNTFGNACYSNTFGNACYSNTFGDECGDNTFGNYCRYNTFGDECYDNTFGIECNYNTFGNYCRYNTFGNACYSNTFGNACYSNTFGQNDNINKVPINYCRYIRFVDNIQYVNIVNSQTASSHQVLKNIEIRDIVGTSDSRVNITADRNLDYTTFVQKNSSGEIKQFCLADLVQ